MKGLKKMIAVVFTIAMVVTFVPQINLGVNADTAKKNSPMQNIVQGNYSI